MKVYDGWDYAVVAVDGIHLLMLLGMLGGMIYLFINEFKKYKV
jgi:hypothetical protein